jgi:hypothetical protein
MLLFYIVHIFDFLKTGQICDEDGNEIPPNTPPTARESDQGPDDWFPYSSRAEFRLAEFLYHRNQMSAGDIDTLLDICHPIWAAPQGAELFDNHSDLYDTIDSTTLGGTPWESFSIKYTSDVPNGGRAPWMNTKFEAWFRDPQQLVANILSNPDFSNEFDTTPYHEYDEDKNHRFHNFMSGDWAWTQAVSDALITEYLDF